MSHHLTIFVLCLLAGAPVARGATLVELRDQVSLPPQSLIQLRDVAQLADADPATVERLGKIPLVPAPASGRSVRITFDEIRSRLQAHGVNLATLEFRGHQATEVRVNSTAKPAVRTIAYTRTAEPAAPAGETVRRPAAAPTPRELELASELVLSAFRRAFRTADLENQGWRIVCELSPSDARLLLMLRAEELHFRESQIRQGIPQQLSVWWLDSAGANREIAVHITIEQTPLALAIRESLPAGAIIRPEDLKWEVAPAAGTGLTRLADVVGKQTTKNVRAGHLLAAEDLTAVPLVRANDIVTVAVRRNGVTVRRPFKAQGGGAMHEAITLTAVDDPRLKIQGIVTGYHEATVAGEAIEPRNVYQDMSGGTPLSTPLGLRPEGGR